MYYIANCKTEERTIMDMPTTMHLQLKVHWNIPPVCILASFRDTKSCSGLATIFGKTPVHTRGATWGGGV